MGEFRFSLWLRLEYDIVPNCVKYTFKELKIETFRADENVFRLVEYIMKNTQYLELLSVLPSNLHRCYPKWVKEEIMEKILSYQKGV